MRYDIHYTMCHHITPQAGENGVKMRGKTAGKEEKNKGRKRKGKRREQAGQTRAWRYTLPHGRKGKTVIMQSWERAAFVPLDVSFCDRKRNSVYGNNRIA